MLRHCSGFFCGLHAPLGLDLKGSRRCMSGGLSRVLLSSPWLMAGDLGLRRRLPALACSWPPCPSKPSRPPPLPFAFLFALSKAHPPLCLPRPLVSMFPGPRGRLPMDGACRRTTATIVIKPGEKSAWGWSVGGGGAGERRHVASVLVPVCRQMLLPTLRVPSCAPRALPAPGRHPCSVGCKCPHFSGLYGSLGVGSGGCECGWVGVRSVPTACAGLFCTSSTTSQTPETRARA